jgi:hypothetical protein
LVDQLVDLTQVVRHLAERVQAGLEPPGQQVQDAGGVLAQADAPGSVGDPLLGVGDGFLSGSDRGGLAKTAYGPSPFIKSAAPSADS